MQSEQINELAKALATAQAKIESAELNKINPHFKSKYADLASVIDSIRAPLSANGIAVSQTMELRDGLVLRTVLMHTSGQWIASEYPLPATARPQEMGSALTYARRYSLSALVCNAADEDDDGNGAEAGKQKIEARAPKSTPVNIAKPPPGKFTAPVTLALPDNPTAWIAFGSDLVAGVKATGQPDEWLLRNEEGLARMKDEAPKVYERVMTHFTPQNEAAE